MKFAGRNWMETVEFLWVLGQGWGSGVLGENGRRRGRGASWMVGKWEKHLVEDDQGWSGQRANGILRTGLYYVSLQWFALLH